VVVTAIEIINFALSDCGATLIATLDDDLPEARTAKAKYAAIRDAVIEDREWTFAKKRVELSKMADVPAFGYAYQYVIPSDCIRVIRVYDAAGVETSTPMQADEWVREGYAVLTNEDAPIYAELLMRAGEGSFSPGMVLALAARLTSAFAVPLTENRQLKKDAFDEYQKLIIDAGAMDGSQGRTQVLRPPALPGRRPSGL
jgi:hypothetical protein